MRKFIATILLCVLMFTGAGCMAVTQGEAQWEVGIHVRHKQIDDGPEPAKAGIDIPPLNKLIDNMSDGKVTEGE